MKKILYWIFKDIWRKLLAVVLACLLFWNLSSREKVTKEITVPMEIRVANGIYLPDNQVVDIPVVVKGSERSLRDLKISCRVKIERKDVRNGECVIVLRPENFDRRKDVEIVSIRKSEIRLPVQLIIQKDVAVKVVTEGAVREGFMLKGAIAADPLTVRISGPEDEVKAIKNIETEPVNLDFSRSFSQKIKLVKPLMPHVSCSASEVIAKVLIERKEFMDKEFKNVPVRFLYPAGFAGSKGAWEIKAEDKINVTVTASETVLSKIDPADVYVVADLPAKIFTSSDGKQRLTLDCPLSRRNFEAGQVYHVGILPAEAVVSVRMENNKK